MARRKILLTDLLRLAKRGAPRAARLESAFAYRRGMSWWPAHELAHALVEPRERHSYCAYGRCDISYCWCAGEECMISEAAAMALSHDFVTSTGRVDLVDAENEATDYEFMTRSHHARGRKLFVKLELWPPPRTLGRLEKACEWRLGNGT